MSDIYDVFNVENTFWLSFSPDFLILVINLFTQSLCSCRVLSQMIVSSWLFLSLSKPSIISEISAWNLSLALWITYGSHLTIWKIFYQFHFANIRSWHQAWRNIWHRSFWKMIPLLWVICNIAFWLFYLDLLDQDCPLIFCLAFQLSLGGSLIRRVQLRVQLYIIESFRLIQLSICHGGLLQFVSRVKRQR